MKIQDFNYFADQQAAGTKVTANNSNAQDFDLDVQILKRTSQENGPVVQGSGHIWCHPTHENCVVSFFTCA
jgi:hypothetical protein